MALDLSGRDVALARQESTGKFDLVFSGTGPNKGNPTLDNTGAHAVLTTLLSRRRGTRPGSRSQEAGYYYDPQDRRGTLIWTITQDRAATTSQLQVYAEDGGQQLLDLRMVTSFSAKATRVAPGRFQLVVLWRAIDGTTPSPLRLTL